MPYKDKESSKIYYQNNKDKVIQQHKKYYEQNKDKVIQHNKKYYEEHKDTLNNLKMNYYHTDKGQKVYHISRWKRRGLIGDMDKIYDEYINTTNCQLCNIVFDTLEGRKSKKCLDHNHETGEFRNILCISCNCKIK